MKEASVVLIRKDFSAVRAFYIEATLRKLPFHDSVLHNAEFLYFKKKSAHSVMLSIFAANIQG